MTAGLLKAKRLHPDARLPTYGSDGAACFDLYAIEDGEIGPCENWHLQAQPIIVFRTGLAFEIPPGWAMIVYSRSGHGFKHGVRLVNGTGIIDSDYRGEVQVGLIKDGGGHFVVRAGDRIAQAMLVRADQWTLQEVDDLSDTARGTGGFGSTGK